MTGPLNLCCLDRLLSFNACLAKGFGLFPSPRLTHRPRILKLQFNVLCSSNSSSPLHPPTATQQRAHQAAFQTMRRMRRRLRLPALASWHLGLAVLAAACPGLGLVAAASSPAAAGPEPPPAQGSSPAAIDQEEASRLRTRPAAGEEGEGPWASPIVLETMLALDGLLHPGVLEEHAAFKAMLENLEIGSSKKKKTKKKNKAGKLRLPMSGEEEEEAQEQGLATSLTLALAKTLGRLGQIDVAKELSLALLGRGHGFPFCAWQVIFDPEVFTPVLLDTNSVYRMQALHFRTRSDVFRITGQFPRVRYFSFQSYDSAGQPLTSLPDFLVRERQCGSNPFTNPCLTPGNETGTYEIYVTADGQHGYPNELAALRDPSLIVSTTTILYRLYGKDPSVRAATAEEENRDLRLWGFVEPPVVERRVMGEERWERMPFCEELDMQRVAEEFVDAERKYLFPLPPQDDVCGLHDRAGREGVVDRMYPFGHLEPRRVSNYVVYTNKDSNYLYWCESVNRLGPDFLLVLRGRLPTTPAGLFVDPRVAQPQAYEARYVSISTVENMAPSDTYQSVYDAELEAHFQGSTAAGAAWDRRYTIVAAANESVLHACGKGLAPVPAPYYFLPFARQGLTGPRLPGLVYREILARYRVNGEPDASAAYLKSVCDAGNEGCSEAAPLAELSERIMGEAYPRIEVYACDGRQGGWRRLN